MVTDQLAAALDGLVSLDAETLDDGELHDAVVALGRLTSRLHAVWCTLIRQWDVRRVWADDGSKAAGARLSRQCGMRKAAADHVVHQARELAAMPHTAAAFAAGEITADHVDLLAAANGSGRHSAFAADEATLVELCTTLWYPNTVRAIDYWKLRNDADFPDDAERVRHGRHATIGTGWRGEVVLNAVFDPIGGITFEEELHRIGEHLRLQDERTGTIRTLQQRRLDALVEMATRSATAPADGLRPRPLLTVTIGIEPFNNLCELANGTVIPPSQLIPLLTDADIERIVYDPPNRRIEASHKRSFTGALRRIIEVRDRHCQHTAGCNAPASRCDIDHIHPHSHGGPTTIDNGRLLCPTHNRIPQLRNPPPLAATTNTRRQERPPPPQ